MNLVKRTALVLATAVVFFLVASTSHAQVVGVSAVLNSTNANEIDGYSLTEIQDAETAYYYDAGVIGYLFQDQSECVSPIPYEDYGFAEAYPSCSVHQGSVYTVYSEHYLIAYFVYSDGYYYNPGEYSPGDYFSSPGGGDPSGTGYEPGGGYEYVTEEDIYLGYTYVQISTAPPSISSINPSSAIRGSSGTIQVQGQNLRDDLGVLSAAFRDGDISVSVASGDAASASLNYSVSSSASIGTHQLTVSNTWGESEPSNFTVGYPPAVITNVNPSTWIAGTDYDVTVTGTGFGSNPSVSAIASGVASGAAFNSSPDGTQTHFHVHVDINAPDEPVQIIVVPGYSGSNYICGNCNGGSPNGNSTADVQATVPSPTIMRVNSQADQANCMNGTQTQSGQNETDVFAGEQVLLCVLPPPAGVRASNPTWNVEQASDITGGFVSTDGTQMPSAANGGREADRPATNQNSFSFYFLDINTRETVTFTWTLANGNQASSTADFLVKGPSGNVFTADIQNDATGTRVTTPTTGNARLASYNSPTFAVVGINFRALGAPPAGANQNFMWVQILNPQSYSSVGPAGSKDPTESKPMGLDGTYPYGIASSNSTNDSPNIALPSNWGEVKKFFDATMYLMWDPALPSGCHPAMTDTSHPGAYTSTPSDCTSIPVPLSSIRWEWSGCSINALSEDGSTPNWFKQCGAGIAKQIQANGYPVWTQRIPSDNAP